MRQFITLLLLFATLHLHAQQDFSARVVDAATGDAIAYANIRVGSDNGTQANSQGYFTINARPDEMLRISCVGFETISIKASQLGATVRLKAAERKLREVEVKKMEPLLVRVSHQMSEAYKTHRLDTATYFLRQLQLTGKRRELGEAFFVARSACNLRRMGFITGRHGRQTEDGSITEGHLQDVNFHYLLELAPMMHDAKWDDTILPLKDGASESYYRRNYDITYDIIVGDDGHDIYVISLNAKPANEDYIYTGILYVDAETLFPLRMDGQVEHYHLEMRRHNTMGVRYVPVSIKVSIDYSHSNGFPEVMGIRTEWRSEAGYSQTQAYRVDNIKFNAAHYHKYENMYDAIDNAGYDEDFWQQHEVIRRTAEEEALSRHFAAPQSVAGQAMAQDIRESSIDTVTVTRPSLDLGSVAEQPSTLQEYAARLQQFGRTMPQEKVYVHTDNSCYFAGDTIYFAAYTRRTDDGTPSSISRVLYVELWSPEGYLVERQLIRMDRGRGNGDFVLPDTIYGGFYELRAYTRWQLNWGQTEHPHTSEALKWFYNEELAHEYYRDYDKLYSRVFPVYDHPKTPGDYQKDMTSRPLRRYFNDAAEKPALTLTLYPEGGTLVDGLSCRVAFEAATEHGQWLNGRLTVTSGRDTVATATTVNRGRGTFELTPQHGRKYTAHFVEYAPTGDAYPRTVKTTLPDAETNGVALSLNHVQQGWQARIAAHGIAADKPLGITAMHEGVLEFFATANADTTIILPDMLRTGVNQLTVFDATGRVWADRLFFVGADSVAAPSLTVEGLSDEYAPYSRVELSLQSANAHSALLSVAVHDANTNEPLNDNGSLLTEMLLASELKGFIPQPAYFFEANDDEHRQALDLLMLTQGWRRFDWHTMATPKAFTIKHPAEYTQVISGQVLPYQPRIRQDDFHELEFEDFRVTPPETYRQSTASLERIVGQSQGGSERRKFKEWLYEQEPGDNDPPTWHEKMSLFEYLDNYPSQGYTQRGMHEEYAVLIAQMRARDVGSSLPHGSYRITGNIATTRFQKTAGTLPNEMRIHAEFTLPEYEPLFTEGTTKDGKFNISTPEITGGCYFFLAASDTTRWKRKRHTWLDTDETVQPEAYVHVSWPYPRFVKPYNYYQTRPASTTSPSEVRGFGMSPNHGDPQASTQMPTITVRASRGGLRKFDASHPALRLDAYEAFNAVADAGLNMGWYEGRTAFINSLARCYVGDMNTNNPYLLEPRYNGRNTSFNIPTARRNDYNQLYNLDSVYIYTDYAPRLPDERFTEDNMPRVTIDLRKAANDTQRYTYRDRFYILPGFSTADAFYSPNYTLSPPTEATSDYRRTLYWNPALQLDASGKAKIQLYTGTRPATLVIKAEGIQSDGTILSSTP